MDSWDNPAYEAALAYQKTASLMAAIKLDIVTLIGGGDTSNSLAQKTAASKPGESDIVQLSHSDGLS